MRGFPLTSLHGSFDFAGNVQIVTLKRRRLLRFGLRRGPIRSGPFYCPEDEKVYIDLGFYSELKERVGVPGGFAETYVLAHDIGHHVQNLPGIESKVRQREEPIRD